MLGMGFFIVRMYTKNNMNMFQKPNDKIRHDERDETKCAHVKETFVKAINASNDPEALYNKVIEFAHDLQKRYPDYMHYEFYHILVGSTPHSEDKNGKDFPGEDSVEQFINNL